MPFESRVKGGLAVAARKFLRNFDLSRPYRKFRKKVEKVWERVRVTSGPLPPLIWPICRYIRFTTRLVDGMERCGHNRVWVADVRRAMAPSGAGPVHGSYKRP